LPTWYEVRICEAGHLGARGGIDPDGGDEPADLGQGRRRDRARRIPALRFTKPLPASKFRDDINVIGVPLTEICNREYTDPRQRQLFQEHHLCRSA